MKTIRERLAALEAAQPSFPPLRFTVEGGGEFTPDAFPLVWLMDNGPVAPDGRRITGIAPGTEPEAGQAVLLSILETCTYWIENGAPPWEVKP